MMKNKSRLIIVLLAMALSACGSAATATPTASVPANKTETVLPSTAETTAATSTPRETSAAAIEPTPSAGNTPTPAAEVGLACSLPLPSEKEWPVVLCETFADNSHGWTVESQDNAYARYSIDVQDGSYALDYTAKSFASFQRSALSWFDVASAQDFALSVSTLMDSDFQNCSWGVAFRAAENMDSFFLFSIHNDNTYAFEIYENNNWIPLISQRPYDGILSGEANKLTIVAESGDFNFYINDVLVNSFSGGLLQDSGILLVVSAKEGVSTNYSFDNIVLQANP